MKTRLDTFWLLFSLLVGALIGSAVTFEQMIATIPAPTPAVEPTAETSRTVRIIMEPKLTDALEPAPKYGRSTVLVCRFASRAELESRPR